MEQLFKFDLLGEKYKITYLGKDKVFVNITALLRGLDIPVETIRFEYQGKGQWFIPNLDYTGVSKIEIRKRDTKQLMIEKVIERSLGMKPKGQNIICLGLNKTGTSSFSSGLKNLGYKMFSEPSQFHYLVPSVYQDDWFPVLSVLNNPRYNLFNDQPFSFPGSINHIYQNRPNDIYVLTVRKNSEDWFQSVMKNYHLNLEQNKPLEDNSIIHTVWTNEHERLMLNQVGPMFHSWGLKNSNNRKQDLIDCYEKHIEDTLKFFKGRDENFKVVCVSENNELEKLSKWLGVDCESKDFPWENKTST